MKGPVAGVFLWKVWVPFVGHQGLQGNLFCWVGWNIKRFWSFQPLKTGLNSTQLAQSLSFQHPDSTGSRCPPFVTFATLMALGHLEGKKRDPWVFQMCALSLLATHEGNITIKHQSYIVIPYTKPTCPTFGKLENHRLVKSTSQIKGRGIRDRSHEKKKHPTHLNLQVGGCHLPSPSLLETILASPTAAQIPLEKEFPTSTHQPILKTPCFFSVAEREWHVCISEKFNMRATPTNHGEEQQEHQDSPKKWQLVFIHCHSVLWLPLGNWRWLQKRRLSSSCNDFISNCYEWICNLWWRFIQIHQQLVAEPTYLKKYAQWQKLFPQISGWCFFFQKKMVSCHHRWFRHASFNVGSLHLFSTRISCWMPSCGWWWNSTLPFAYQPSSPWDSTFRKRSNRGCRIYVNLKKKNINEILENIICRQYGYTLE